jgi:chromosome segregation ATPase
MQDLVRQRDDELENLRDELNAQKGEVERLQQLAEERLEALEDLRDTARREKQDVEDELDLMIEQVDEINEEKASLEEKISVLESMLREKESQSSAMQTETRAAQREQKAALESKIRDLESRMREKDSHYRKLQSEAKAAQRDQQSALQQQLRHLESQLRDKESSLRLLQASSKSIQHKAHQDAIDLDEQAEALTKRHIKEINGLAKQIQYLRARCSRAEAFREALGYQKRFFLMQIQVYSEWYVPFPSPSPPPSSYPLPNQVLPDYLATTNTHPVTSKTSTSSPKWASRPTSPSMSAGRNSNPRRWRSSRQSGCRS